MKKRSKSEQNHESKPQKSTFKKFMNKFWFMQTLKETFESAPQGGLSRT